MPKRIQMTRQRPWRADNPDAVIVARPSRWGNPFPIDDYGVELSLALFRNTLRGSWSPRMLDQAESDDFWDATYERHMAWVRRINAGYDQPISLARYELRGRDLACWCPLDKPCHADVLLEVANS